MVRVAAFAFVASGALVAASGLTAAPAQAQQICCAPAPSRGDGMRGYAQPQYPQYAPPEYAERPPSLGLKGYVGVEYGNARVSSGTPPSDRVESWTGEGAVSGQIGSLDIQGDLKVANYETRSSSDSTTSISPTVHLFKRTDNGLVGGWAGWSHADGANLYGLGLEGQAHYGSATFYGSAGYGHVNDDTDADLYAARLEGRYFVTENFMLNATAGLVRANAAGDHATVRSIGVGTEFQPSTLPISLLASYTHADVSNSSVDSDTFRLGLRWNLQRGTLAERNRFGPSLNNVSDLFLSN